MSDAGSQSTRADQYAPPITINISEPEPADDSGYMPPPPPFEAGGIGTSPSFEDESPGPDHGDRSSSSSEPGGSTAATDAAHAQRAALVDHLAGHICTGLKLAGAIVREANQKGDTPIPALPDSIVDMVMKPAWIVCLDRWLPTDTGNLDDVAPYVAVAGSTYQVGLAVHATNKMKKRAPSVASSRASAPVSEPPPSSPTPPAKQPEPGHEARKSEPDKPRAVSALVVTGKQRKPEQEDGDWAEWQSRIGGLGGGAAEEPR